MSDYSRDKLRKAFGEPTTTRGRSVKPLTPTSSPATTSDTKSSANPKSLDESLLLAKGRTNQLKWFPRIGASTACVQLFDSTKGGTIKDIIFSNGDSSDRNVTVFITNIYPGNWTDYPDFAGISSNTTDYVYLLSALTVSANTTTTLSKACGLLNAISSDGSVKNKFYIYAFASGQRIDITLVL